MLTPENNPRVELARLAARLAGGEPGLRVSNEIRQLVENLGEPSRSGSAERLEFARALGVPLLPTIECLAGSLRYTDEIAIQVTGALAASKLTSNILAGLPWVSLLIGQLMGLSPFSFLLANPLGWIVLAVCLLFTYLSGRWQRKICNRASATPEDPGAWYEALAVAFVAGVTVSAAVGAMAIDGKADPTRLQSELAVALNSNGGISTSMYEAAKVAREANKTQKQAELARLPQTLLLPIGLFSIPQFMLLLVLPTVVSAASVAIK